MLWLVAHIWIFIGLAALLGLVLGWAVRGIRVSGGARRAVVERNIALTELDQVRAELDSLYTAQRAHGGDGQALEELQARETRIGELEAALASARQEVVTVKADGEKKLLAAAAASAAAVGAGAAMASGGQQNETPVERLDANVNPGNAQLEWRNRYLESRVRSLESISDAETVAVPDTPIVEDMSERVAELEAGNAALQSQLSSLEQELEEEKTRDRGLAAGITGAVAGAGVALTGQDALAGDGAESDPVDTVADDKIAWQNKYLRQRLAYMEDHGMTQAHTVATPIEAVEDPDMLMLAVENGGSPDADASIEIEREAEAGDIEQELARLRWRNRYLEGRLAYIDGDAPSDDGADPTEGGDAKQTAAEALLARLEGADDPDG